MYFPAPDLRYEDADTSLLLVDGGEVPFTLEFKLRGSLLAYNCEIDARITSAQGAFQAIRNNFFSAKGINKCAQENCLLRSGALFFIIPSRNLEYA
jgi:hypothetical protein